MLHKAERAICESLTNLHNRHLFGWDLVIQPVVVWLSFVIRLEKLYPNSYAQPMLRYAILAAIVVPATFYTFGMYRRFWSYASLSEAKLVGLSSSIASITVGFLVLVVLVPLNLMQSVPRSIPFLHAFFTVAAAALPRFLIRVGNHYRTLSKKEEVPAETKRVLIIGAGDAGNMVLREILDNPQLGWDPVGFVDDDVTKQGLEILDCSVLGSSENIPGIASEYAVDQAIIAIPTASGKTIRRLMNLCQEANLETMIVPGVFELLSGQVSIDRLRKIQINDLLRRDPVSISQEQVAQLLKDKRVLVTGGGGSIGSEICRQVARCQPAKVLIVGHGENSIYQINRELKRRFPVLAAEAIIADIRDAERMEQVFHRWRPQVCFHAAAHKHVPLMEANMPDAVTNNVLGTKTVLEMAVKYDVQRLVMISTDKAVNPTSVMGVTKRIAEQLVQDTAQRIGKAFVAVRFGNVLGSRGSVVPLFQQQIAQGGPVTVTHPEVKRYFMTIPEAVQLVLQASVFGQGGELFVLDMGDPIKIVNLACDLIELSGFHVEEDIEIEYIGLRPGEKLFEELISDEEEYIKSPHPKILALQENGSTGNEGSVRLRQQVDQLIAAAQAGDQERLRDLLHAIVPEYQEPNGVQPVGHLVSEDRG